MPHIPCIQLRDGSPLTLAHVPEKRETNRLSDFMLPIDDRILHPKRHVTAKQSDTSYLSCRYVPLQELGRNLPPFVVFQQPDLKAFTL